VADVKDAPHTGDVFWCAEFPGLHGNQTKERYAVVIAPPDKLPDDDGNYLVVPTSASTASKFAFKLPNRADQPQTTSGLPSRCWAVCDEYKLVKLDVLTEWKGDLRTTTVTRLQQIVLAVKEERKATDQESRQTPPDA
jgi:mRNA-degrading endonuclease toxin of MazEF toxin-antitoxin module